MAIGLLAATPLRAASMQKVNQSDWWAGVTGLPSYVNMYIYVPDQLASKPPIVVAPHHCQGTAQSTYSEMSSLVTIANTKGFIMVIPEATGQNCWDAGSTRSLKHGGGGDTGAVVQMVKYTLTKYDGNASRVYTVGGSSGGIMTEALLGVYPDVFMAGVSLMGVPCGCWAEGYNDITGNGSTAQWADACASGDVTKTGQAWGDEVRSYYTGYTGHRPRLQHWHGTADTTINYKNMAEDVKEWINLLGLAETPTGADTPKSGTARQFWTNDCGYTVYETFALSGVGHAVPFDGNAVSTYFGLDNPAGPDPETAACGTGMTGMGGQGGQVGAGGQGGMAGTAGGQFGGAGGPSGGATGESGSSQAGDHSGAGGAALGGGGATARGGASGAATGGSAGMAVQGGSGSSARGGTTCSSRTAPARGGGGSAGSSGTQSSGGSAAGPASVAQAGASDSRAAVQKSSEGCGCVVAGSTRNPSYSLAAVALCGVGVLRRRRLRRALPATQG